MENGSRVLRNLPDDIQQVFASTTPSNAASNGNDIARAFSPVMHFLFLLVATSHQANEENEADVIRRRRVEHYANRVVSSTSPDTQDEGSQSNA